MKKPGFMKDAGILFVITLIAGIMLGFVYQITLEPIARAKENAKQTAYKQVFSEAVDFVQLNSKADFNKIKEINEKLTGEGFGKVSIKEVALAKGSSSDLGYVVTSSSMDGYGGEIVLTIGITFEGKVNGIEYLTLAETPGLGMKARESSFTSQFVGKEVTRFEVVKAGQKNENSIDALSGATITSKAVTGAVNAALLYVQSAGGM